jgi:hypothetical protein
MRKLIDERFALGVNLAWLDNAYDHDFGNNEIMKHGSVYEQHKESMDSYFRDIRDMGARVVRLYVFERFEGLKFEQDQVRGIDDAIVENISDVLHLARKYELYLYLCLMDTWSVSAHAQEHLQLLNNIIAKEDVRKSFMENSLKPFLSDIRIKGNDRIFAIDIMNEPEGMYTSIWRADIEWNDVLNFIRECASVIHETGKFRVSCGFQHYQTLMDSKDALGELDFYDYHEYNDDGTLIPFSTLNLKRPCVIGACGQKHENFDDKIQSKAIEGFLKNSWKHGYAGCLLWNYNYRGYDASDANNRYSLIKSSGERRDACNAIANFAKKHRRQMLWC